MKTNFLSLLNSVAVLFGLFIIFPNQLRADYTCSAQCLLIDYHYKSVQNLGTLISASENSVQGAFRDLNEACQELAFDSSCSYQLGDPVTLARSINVWESQFESSHEQTWQKIKTTHRYPYFFEQSVSSTSEFFNFYSRQTRIKVQFASPFDPTVCTETPASQLKEKPLRKRRSIYCGIGQPLP